MDINEIQLRSLRTGDVGEDSGSGLEKMPTAGLGKAVRPTGDSVINWGFGALFVAVSSMLVALMTEGATAFNLLLLSGGLTNVGVILLSCGYVVRAISFLPGKSER